MAVGATRRDTLRKPAVGHFLDGGVYPSETEGLFYHIEIWQRPVPSLFAPIGGYPALVL